MLSDHVVHFLGRTITITGQEQLALIVVVAIGISAWVLQQFRRRRVIIVHRSAVSDQLLYELARIADALDRVANRPVDQMFANPSLKTDDSRLMPLSMFGRER